MDATPAITRLGIANLSFEQVAASSHIDQQTKIAEAARQFESVLLRQMLTDIRKPIHHSNPEGQGAANAIYDDLINGTLADSISRSGMLGFARSLEKELTFQTLGRPGEPTHPTAAAPAAIPHPDRHD